MRGMYNIHDADNKRMGFVPFIGSNKSLPVVSNTTPSTTMPNVAAPDTTFTWTEIAIIILFLAVILAIIALIIWAIVRLVKNCFNVSL